MSWKRRRGAIERTILVVVASTVLLSSRPLFVSSYEVCGHSYEAGGGGICPDGNTCCRMSNGRTGCIPNDMGNNSTPGTCCPDGLTGCAPGYVCSGEGSDWHGRLGLQDGRRCVATEPWAAKDPLVRVMPRYVLCHPPAETLATVHGLSIDGVVPHDARLAYHSSGGDIQRDDESHVNITMALVVVHGANRNADDYFCSATAAVSLQSTYHPDSVLVLAPRFLVPADGPVNLTTISSSSTSLDGTATTTTQPLRWEDEGAGPWRYGAPAVYPPHVAAAGDVSSFRAVDQILDELGNSTRFPSLRRITVTGHSSGGQFVQRWALLTSSWPKGRRHHHHYRHRRLDDEDANEDDKRQQQKQQQQRGMEIVAVVANPSSYAYLTPERFFEGSWRVPPASAGCPTYDGWEWGLDRSADPKYRVRYVDEALEGLGNNTTLLAERFATRRVYYLSGGSDRCNVSGTVPNGWCNSHGLETSCMDELQGSNRFVRGERYFSSLVRSGVVTTHRRIVVPGVGHDHTLMFTSDAGLFALFGDSPGGSVSSNTG